VVHANLDYAAELSTIRKAYIEHWPQARLNVIRQRLQDSEQERGPARLVTIVSCVEALARSMIVAAANPKTFADFLRAYEPIERSGASWLVAEVLRLNGIADPGKHLKEDTWLLFGYAVDFRNMIVHEATYLGQDKWPLYHATDEVLRELVRLGRLTPLPDRV